MSAKLKSMFKKQISWSVGHTISEQDEEDEAVVVRKAGKERSRAVSDGGGDAVALRTRSTRRRHRTSLGVLEDIIKCPICKQILQSPRMLDCQHTFCKKCLEIKLDQTSKKEENVLRCPVCQTLTHSSTPDNLPTNLSIESVLRAVDGNFVEARHDKARSLVVNFAPLAAEHQQAQKRGKTLRCVKCETACEATDYCRHCKQVFCKVCQAIHVAHLKDQLKVIIDQLQATIGKLEHRVVEFKEKTNNMKEMISKEYEARIAVLKEEREKKLELIDEFRTKEESAAEEIRQRILDSQQELARQQDGEFDETDDDNRKIATFLELHMKATEMISSAVSWQTKVADIAEMKNVDIARLRDKENKISSRPRLVSERAGLQRPSGLAVDNRKGDVYVACPGSGQVVVFDRQYRIMRRIQNQNMMAPQSVAFIESLQEIFVTDKWKHTIFVFNRKGHLVRTIGEKGQGEGQLRCPEGIDALQSRNWIYVADTGNDRIQIVGVDGAFKGGIGPNEKPVSPGAGGSGKTVARITGVHNFNQPTDVAVSNNAIVVADCGHHKIKVFNHKGQLMFSIGGFGSLKGLLKSPEVVKLDENNNIYVGDSDNGRIQVFSPQGTFLRAFGNHGGTVGLFGWISGLVCLPRNDILVADSKNNTLQLF